MIVLVLIIVAWQQGFKSCVIRHSRDKPVLAIVKDYVANVEVKVVRCCVASVISAPLTCYHGGLDCVESFRWLANQVGHTGLPGIHLWQ